MKITLTAVQHQMYWEKTKRDLGEDIKLIQRSGINPEVLFRLLDPTPLQHCPCPCHNGPIDIRYDIQCGITHDRRTGKDFV